MRRINRPHLASAALRAPSRAMLLTSRGGSNRMIGNGNRDSANDSGDGQAAVIVLAFTSR
jgi:hypothetical protein